MSTVNGRRRVAVVTGASAGVGRATARELAQRGADVALVARGDDGLRAAAREVESFGRSALVVRADVSDAEAVEEAAARTERDLGPIDVWINAAMTSVFSPFTEMEHDEFRRVTEVTYLGYVNGTRAALRRMKSRDRGTIVQVGSALAYRGIPLQSAYCGAKHAIQGFTESVRTELLHDGSRVRLIEVHLPALNTPQFDVVKSHLPRRAQPVPPIYQPEVAAGAIAWASEHGDWEVHVGGTTVATILANKVAPRLLDRYLGRTGFDSQQTDEPEDPERPYNLWEPVSGDHGAHGRFDDRSKPRSVQWWLNERRRVLVAVAAVGAAAVLAARGRSR
ncbi:MAG TPA: SDR family oxidoreductase [Actinomycetota bacterium]|nr:SDR family oxidoreductase [Actinomycetota bacterium]